VADPSRADRLPEGIRQALDALEETHEAIVRRTGRDLVMAILIGLALGGLLLASLLVFKFLFTIFLATAVAFGALELAWAMRGAGYQIPRVAIFPVGFAIPIAGWFFGIDGLWIALLLGAAVLALWRLVERIIARLVPAAAKVEQEAGPGLGLLQDWAGGFFVLAYVPFLGGFAVALAEQPGGEWWVLAFAITVVAIDTAAYAVGLNFGKHPMAPTISPKKSWEGFAGAVLGAAIAGVLLAIFMLGQPWWIGLILGGIMLLTATIGDLAESWLKRDLGVKDMSSWLPGHGGFLDRLDSMLFSCAAAFLLYAAVFPLQ